MNNKIYIFLILGVFGITGFFYNNCTMYLKYGLDSDVLSEEHKNIALKVFRVYRDKFDVIFPYFDQNIPNNDKWLTRNKTVFNYEDFKEDLYETIDFSISELGKDHVWYYTEDDLNVGAKNYEWFWVNYETVKKERLENIEAAMLDNWNSRNDENEFNVLYEIELDPGHADIQRMFFELFHEMDHTVKSSPHDEDFVDNYPYNTRALDLSSMLNYDEFTYFLAQGAATFFLSMFYSLVIENGCLSPCVESLLTDYNDEFDYFEYGEEERETIVTAICEDRSIPRDSNQASFCERSSGLIEAYENFENCDCAEILISQLELKNTLSLMYVSFGNTGLTQQDFEHFNNLATLEIRHTDLTFIALDAFDNLPYLTKVILEGNNLDQDNISDLINNYPAISFDVY